MGCHEIAVCFCVQKIHVRVKRTKAIKSRFESFQVKRNWQPAGTADNPRIDRACVYLIIEDGM